MVPSAATAAATAEEADGAINGFGGSYGGRGSMAEEAGGDMSGFGFGYGVNMLLCSECDRLSQ